jgi:hypothetical protein
LGLDLDLHATDRVAEALADRFTGIHPTSGYVRVSTGERSGHVGQSRRGRFFVHAGEHTPIGTGVVNLILESASNLPLAAREATSRASLFRRYREVR